VKPFSVPQFINIEDKVIGPLTLKQFLWCLAGIIVLFVLWISLPLFLFIPSAIPVIALFSALAFYKINGRPFIYFILSGLNFLIKPKLYLFQKSDKALKSIIQKEKPAKQIIKPKPKLKDLAWKLDVQRQLPKTT